MTIHASENARRVHPKSKDRGTAHSLFSHERRHKSIEGKYGYIGAGATIAGAAVQSSGVIGTYYPGIVYDSTGLKAYNSSGVVTMSVSATDGSVTVNGTGVITGGTIQTSASNPRVIMDGSGLRGYNGAGTNTFNLSGADGSLNVQGGTITGGIIQTAGGSSSRVVLDTNGIRAYDSLGNNTVNVDTTGALTVSKGSITLASTPTPGTGARVLLDSTGIKGYNASNVMQFQLDATSGLITATGVITAQSGSAIPTSTITGSLPGGANRLSNSNFQDGSGDFSQLNWSFSNFSSVSGSIGVIPPVSGTLSLLWTVSSSGNVTITPNVLATTRTDTATVTSGSPTVTDASIKAGDQGSAVTGTGIPSNTYVGTVTDGVSFLLSSSPNSQVNVNATTNGTSVAVTTFPGDPTDPYKAVIPDLNYSFSWYVWPVTNSRGAKIDINWYDKTGTLLSTSTGTISSSLSTGQWTRHQRTAAPPANAAFAVPVFTIVGCAVSDQFYFNAFQMEMGDQASAYMPRPDEILYNKINANMIDVVTLDAISANLGTVTAGTIIGGSILSGTGAARVGFDSTGIYATDTSGNNIFYLYADGVTPAFFSGVVDAQGVTLPSGNLPTFPPSSASTIEWLRVDDNSLLAQIDAFTSTAVAASGSPTAGANATGFGTVAWTNPGNVLSQDGAVASAVVTNATSNFLTAQGFGFAIPSTATITGISVNVVRRNSGAANIVDAAVRLIKGGVVATTGDHSSSVHWPTALTSKTYGGSNDLWSQTLSYTDVNSSGFGAAIAASSVTTSETRTPGTVASDSSNGSIYPWAVSGGLASVSQYNSPSTSQYLKSTGCGFNIPSNATIVGISVSLPLTVSGGTASDVRMSLTKAGVIQTTNKATSGLGGTYGNQSDLWGTTWTPADINNSGFGFEYSVSSNSNGTTVRQSSAASIAVYYTYSVADVDYIGVTVYYNASGVAGSATQQLESFAYQDGTTDNVSTVMGSRDTTGTTRSQIITNYTPGSSPTAAVLAKVGSYSPTVIDSNGNSGFVQIGSANNAANVKMSAAAGMLQNPAHALTTAAMQQAKFNVGDHDTDGNLISTAGWYQFKCPNTGWYRCVVSICVQLGSGTGNLNAAIFKNGSYIRQGPPVSTSGASYPMAQCVGDVYCVAGDLLEPGLSIGSVSSTNLWSDSRLTYATFQQVT